MASDANDLSSNRPIIDAIERGLADTRASRIMPQAAMTEAIRALTGKPCSDEKVATLTLQRPVVWTLTARDTVLKTLGNAAKSDAAAATALADRLDKAALKLATAACGRPGRIAFTYETTQAAPPDTLVFEIVTWQKAGDVIAILAVVEDPCDPVGHEALIAW